jgi:hypothetical protein
MGVGPPSRIRSIRPWRSSQTCLAMVGLGRPNLFAEGAAMGTALSSMSLLATGWLGMRTATVSNPPVVTVGTLSVLGKTSVSGPGQNLSIRSQARWGICRAS